MRAELANLNHCAVSFLSRAADNLCWYYYTTLFLRNIKKSDIRKDILVELKNNMLIRLCNILHNVYKMGSTTFDRTATFDRSRKLGIRSSV